MALSATPTDATRMPIFPLSDEVHFPHTELRLQVVEPPYRSLVEELFEEWGSQGQIGTVLLKPGWVPAEGTEPAVFASGTAARLLDLENHDQGCDIVIHGEYRFEVEQEVGNAPWREAVVRPVIEPRLSELDPAVQYLRERLVTGASSLAAELGSRFPLADEMLQGLIGEGTFEELVNHLAAHLDMAPLQKLKLLRDSLPDRAHRLLKILSSRRQVLDVLRPYRHLAQSSTIN